MQNSNSNNTLRKRVIQLLLGALGASVLALAFVAYLRPSFVVDLANRIVLCF
ncbi:hypothetical protein ACFQUU_10425 [Herbaspirillum sp. GCM10030257]|uniref:hypothetical protein n=1 Tax=Herbaspirillum sp. GCM10030257 TaxID=3273393 RepID=UPI0036087681